ncbi:DNA repair helicase rad25 [Lentithecium fluviatile CBS 122367]|uniref:DNA 3'-5' helicase n=1 Tax=Lentithecium fluviatile CBS 122367 TaxID=1168545 RepID=A0A6G1J577_9PLEO|nr:DNA repair helicase rad25 [Lentithecium fluviatile CBS 122367]
MPPKRKAQAVAEDEFSWDQDDTPLEDQDMYDELKDVFAPAQQRTHMRRDAASFLFKFDHADAVLKPDHASRPLWVLHNGRIILESFSPLFDETQDFLINIAEPLSRVSRMHEYTLTNHSLFAAVSVGHSGKEIIARLEKYSKTTLNPEIVAFIEKSTSSFGKAKIVLKKTLSYIESDDPTILRTLLEDGIISSCRADNSEGFIQEAAPKIGVMAIPGTKLAAGASQVAQPAVTEPQAPADMITALREEDDEEEVAQVHSFQIRSEERETVIKRCQALTLPLTEEYDFNNDENNATLDIDLKPHAQIRYYQEKALSKMFSNSRARSGIIVLPCGAGKTLVGITAACGVKKSVVVLCTSAMSVVQWRAEFLKWSNISPDDIAVFTADSKKTFPNNAGILISTYSMLTTVRNRSYDSEKVMQFIKSREWGLLIADEVHVVPAQMFKQVTHTIASHAKLGLTATLLREDDKIQDLNFLIGPKLYEANWQELSEQGHIAKVQCAEVWCQMTPEFYAEWLRSNTNVNKKLLLSSLNPRKFQACQYLIDFHEARGDKIIVFSDNVFALEKYALKLGKAFIYGGTPQNERLRILENFQHNELVNTIFLSKIGDTSLDLPEATCLIQISAHYGSRRQEAQRLGRILRAKRRNDEGFNAFFYSLVSKDTDEMYFSSKRQAFLVDQGYAFKVITHLQGIEDRTDLAFDTPQERRELLMEVCLAKDTDAGEEKIEGDMFGTRFASGKTKKTRVKRTAGTLSELSGGQDMAYIEYNKSRNKEIKAKSVKNNFLRKLKTSTANAKKKAAE